MNARVGNQHDFIKDVDDVKTRKILDTNVNNLGKEFINFLLENGFGIVNGQVNSSSDNFTSVSIKGKAVVDYFVVPYISISLCDSFKVYLAQIL